MRTADLHISYIAPYRFDDLLSFFASRALAGVEKVEDGAYWRTVRLLDDGEERLGWLCVRNNARRECLDVALSDSLILAIDQIERRLSRQFDVSCDPAAVAAGIASLDKLVPGAVRAGTRLPGCFEPFETACRAVMGQQITVTAANRIAGRVVEAYGTPIDTGIAGLTHAFPVPGRLASMAAIEDAFGELGVIKTRSCTMRSIAQGLLAGELSFEEGADAADQFERLLAIKGIGPWSANYIAMRCFSYPDAFLESDAGVKHALPQYEPKERLRLAESWRPWRSYANICLWNSLGSEE